MADRRARSARRSTPRSQHFLRPSFAAQVVRDACVRSDEVVVDLGAGNGRLTAELSRVAQSVVAIELDRRLAAGLQGRWQNVVVIEGDAVCVELPQSPFRVVANLPFHRTADLLHRLFDDPQLPLTRADLVVEWGVAFKRAVPWPSSVSGIIWGAFYETSLERRLPRTAFEPPPSVDAAVLVFRRREQSLVPEDCVAAYHRFVADAFRHGLRGERRPARELDAHEWAELFCRT